MRLKSYTNGPVAVVVGLSITGLGIIRSLSKTGISVIAVDSNFKQPSAHTRHCQTVFCQNISKEEELIPTLIAVSNHNKHKPVLFPSTDMSVLIASNNRELLSKYYRFNLPSKSVVDTFMDKALFAVFAKNSGFQIPDTYVIHGPDDIQSLVDKIHYPCLIKPYFRDSKWDECTPIKAYKIFSKHELTNIYTKKRYLAKKFIIQEHIYGPDSEVYFCLLWYNSLSQPIASFTGRKLAQWPPELGSTCIAQSCSNSVLIEESIKLFSSVSYKGIGSVEFKRDLRHGIFKIIEPTVGRVDLQSALAYHAGMNIPLLEYCDCADYDLPPHFGTRSSIYWINEESLFWLMGKKLKRYSFGSFFHIMMKKKRFALFELSDLLPFLVFLRRILMIALRRR